MSAMSSTRHHVLSVALAVVIGSIAFGTATRPQTDPLRPQHDPAQDVGPMLPMPRLPEEDPLRSALGHDLFYDIRLSRAGNRSCESCHDLTTNGASPYAKDTTAAGKPLPRNTPTVFNAGLSYMLDWKGDASSLEEQAELALLSPDFMDEDWSDVLSKLDMDHDLVGRFKGAYGHGPDREDVLDAIGAFERTLVTPSRFDLWLRGDTAAISQKEKSGYQLFQGIGCAACHQGVNVGGNLFEKVGIFGPLHGKPREKLRVPSLRNVAVTPPYFDDGNAATLHDAVKQMAKAQLGRDLTDEQNEMIVAFLHTLTGAYNGRQLTAPK